MFDTLAQSFENLASKVFIVHRQIAVVSQLLATILIFGVMGCGGEDDESNEPAESDSKPREILEKKTGEAKNSPNGASQKPQVNDQHESTTKTSPKVEKPVIDRNAMRREAISALADVGAVMLNEQGTVISIHQGLDLTDAGLARLEGLAQLTSLDLSQTRVTDQGLASLSKLGPLRVLDLSKTAIGDAAMPSIAKLDSLEELMLRQTKVTDDGLAKLKQMTKLTVLVVSDTEVTDAGLKHISELPQLSVLGLYQTQVGDNGLAHLTGMTQLVELSLSKTSVTNRGFLKLDPTRWKNLSSLYLSGTKVTDAGISVLSQFPALIQLDLSLCPGITDGAIRDLKKCTSLQTLNLSGTEMTESAIQMLSAALPKCEIQF